MRQLRIPMVEFEGVDLANISKIALLFDDVDTGTLFLANMKLVTDN